MTDHGNSRSTSPSGTTDCSAQEEVTTAIMPESNAIVSTARFEFPRGEVLVTEASLQIFVQGSLQALEESSVDTVPLLDTVKDQVVQALDGHQIQVVQWKPCPKARRKKKTDWIHLTWETTTDEKGVDLLLLQELETTIRVSLQECSTLQELLQEYGQSPDQLIHVQLVPENYQIKSQPTNTTSTKNSMVVVDTDVISHFLRKNKPSPPTQRWLRQEAVCHWLLHDFHGRKFISWQTQAELYAWITTLRQPSFTLSRIEQLETLLETNNFEVIQQPDRITCLIWAHLINQCRVMGRPGGAQDLWVAATAKRLGASLCTFNVKDYDYLPGVQFVKVEDEHLARDDGADQATAQEEKNKNESDSDNPKGITSSPSQSSPILEVQKHLRGFDFSSKSSFDQYYATDCFVHLQQTLDIQQSKRHPNLFLFNAKHKYKAVSQLQAQCRGLILDAAKQQWNVVCYPLDQFFNPGEAEKAQAKRKEQQLQHRQQDTSFDWSSCQVFPKEDGTLVNLYHYNGEWHVSTRGRPDADSLFVENYDDDDNDEEETTRQQLTFQHLFWRTFHKLNYQKPPATDGYHQLCFSFEIMTPENRVVVPVPTERLVLLTARDRTTHLEISNDTAQEIARNYNWQVIQPVQQHSTATQDDQSPSWTLEQVRDLADKLSCSRGEGFVCCDKDFRRLKVKSTNYVAASHIPRPNWGLPSDPTAALATVQELVRSPEKAQKYYVHILKLILNGEQSEFEINFPEWATVFRDMTERVNALVARMEAAVTKDEYANRRQESPKSLLQLQKFIKSNAARTNHGGQESTYSLTRAFLEMQRPSYILQLFDEWDIRDKSNTTGNSGPIDKQDPKQPTMFISMTLFVSHLIAMAITLLHEFLILVAKITAAITAHSLSLTTARATHHAKSSVDQELARINKDHFGGFYEKEALGHIMVLEEFLRLLSRDPNNREILVLSGSILTRQFIMPQMRKSSDLDFMANFPWDQDDPVENVLKRIRHVINHHQSLDSPVKFDCTQKIDGFVHFEETEQPGVKCTLKNCTLFGGWSCDIEIDVAFGDPIMPVPFWLDYKPLPPIFEAAKASETIRILTARPELLFAWKLQGLFENNTVDELGRDVQGRWRAKDIFDLWLLMKFMRPELKFDFGALSVATGVAFATRQQNSGRLLQKLLSRRFGASRSSQRQWRSFRNKYPRPDEIPLHLHQVVGELADYLLPLLQTQGLGQGGIANWSEPTMFPGGERIKDISATNTDSRIKAIKKHDASSMVVPLPGLFNVFKTNQRVYFHTESDSSKAIEVLDRVIFGSTASGLNKERKIPQHLLSTVKFLGREDEFEVVKIVPPKTTTKQLPAGQGNIEAVQAGYLQLRQCPSFTARACSGQAIVRQGRDEQGNIMSPTSDDGSPFGHIKGRNLGPAPTAEEEEALQKVKEREDAHGQALARRLQVIQPMSNIAYVTSSHEKFNEAVKCLAEHQQHIVHVTDLKPPFTTRLDPEQIVEKMARYCFSVLAYPCFCDVTWLEIEGPLGITRYFPQADDNESSFFRSTDDPDDNSGKPIRFNLEDNLGKKANLRALVAYCAPVGGEANVQIYEGNLDGRIVGGTKEVPSVPPQPLRQWQQSVVETKLWNRIFIPDGYQEPLSDLGSTAFCLGARHLPFLELAQNLRNFDAGSVFEVHVTVKHTEDGENDPVESFVGVCGDVTKALDTWSGAKSDNEEQWSNHTALKPVLIENASGKTPTQMMTAFHHVGTLEQVHLVAFRISQELAKRGYKILRTKIEALMSNKGIPLTDSEAQLLSPENYFEFHIKLCLPPDFNLPLLQDLAKHHSAHLSRNPKQNLLNGWQKRFVNLRMYAVGKETAVQRLNDCIDAIRSNGFAIDRVIREYSVYDSNINLDAGWIDKEVMKPKSRSD